MAFKTGHSICKLKTCEPPGMLAMRVSKTGTWQAMTAEPQEVEIHFSSLVLESQHLKVEGKILNQAGGLALDGATPEISTGQNWWTMTWNEGEEADIFLLSLDFPVLEWKVELFVRLQPFFFPQLLFQEMLCWFSYGGLVCVPTLVSPVVQHFLYQVRIWCMQITLGLEIGHLPSGYSRTQLPPQMQSDGVKVTQRNQTTVHSGPPGGCWGTGGEDGSWGLGTPFGKAVCR